MRLASNGIVSYEAGLQDIPSVCIYVVYYSLRITLPTVGMEKLLRIPWQVFEFPMFVQMINVNHHLFGFLRHIDSKEQESPVKTILFMKSKGGFGFLNSLKV